MRCSSARIDWTLSKRRWRRTERSALAVPPPGNVEFHLDEQACGNLRWPRWNSALQSTALQGSGFQEYGDGAVVDQVHLHVRAEPTGLYSRPGGAGLCQQVRSEEHTSELQSREKLVC